MRDIAIDLGTANTLVWARGRGIVLNEPTVVAVHERNGDVRAMGRQAYELISRSGGHLVAHRPLVGGAVTDFNATSRLLGFVLQQLGLTRPSRARVLICVPSGVTEVERRALEEAASQAGIGTTYLLEEPLAAAMGAGLPIDQPTGTMLLDVGGGSSQVAMMSLGGIVTCTPIRTGGFDIDDAIARWVRSRWNVAIGERMAEQTKIEIGSAFPQVPEPLIEVRGRELACGLPQSVTLSGDEVRVAIDPCVSTIVRAVVDTLGNCPPELAHDVLESGLWLCGGGAQLRGLDARIATETQVPVHRADHPEEAVIRGAGQVIEEFEDLKHLLTR
ncbi:MAG: rod shape-determining protein [Egibacteraceae bacterium]